MAVLDKQPVLLPCSILFLFSPPNSFGDTYVTFPTTKPVFVSWNKAHTCKRTCTTLQVLRFLFIHPWTFMNTFPGAIVHIQLWIYSHLCNSLFHVPVSTTTTSTLPACNSVHCSQSNCFFFISLPFTFQVSFVFMIYFIEVCVQLVYSSLYPIYLTWGISLWAV